MVSSENQQPDISTFPPNTAILYQRLQEDPAAALREANESGNNDALFWLLNNLPEFRPRESVPATSLGWTEGTGVWVLEGTWENRRAYEKVCEENPSLSYNEALEKAGAKYYEHWKDHPEINRFMSEQENH